MHGEPQAISALAARLEGVVGRDDALIPALDECFELTPRGAVRLAGAEPPRIDPGKVGRMDWHNDASRLLLDIDEALRNAADERARGVLIRRLAAVLRHSGEIRSDGNDARHDGS